MDIRPTANTVHTGPLYTDKAVTNSQPPAVSVKPVAEPSYPTAVQQPGPASSAAEVAEAVKNINEVIQSLSQNVEFSIDKDTEETIVKVVDKETKEVIRQMPSKETLEIAKALDKVQGLLIKQQA